MEQAKQRTELLIGAQGLEKLKNAVVMVVGLGGVGGICAESLARSGVGTLILIDKDEVEPSNINRQIVALYNTVGRRKTEILQERIEQINPECKVVAFSCFYDRNMNEQLLALKPDFIIDCIDSLKSKMDLIQLALENDIPFIVATGTARKKDPSQLKIMELEQTSYDPLAKRLRVWKRKNKIRQKIMVVCSTEIPKETQAGIPLASMMFVPASAGLLLASYCVNWLLNH